MAKSQRKEQNASTEKPFTQPSGKEAAGADFYELMFDSIQDGLSVIDQERTILKTNQSMRTWS